MQSPAELKARADRLAPWIRGLQLRRDARVRLVCFPYAGAGASIYRGWSEMLPRQIEVWPVQLPGREDRFREPPLTSRSELIRTLADKLGPELDTPFCFFGHSLGANLAFELACELRRRGDPEPDTLFLSARRPPHLPSRGIVLHTLSDDQLVSYMRQARGTPDAVLDTPELREIYLPTLRADFTLSELEPGRTEEPLSCRIVALAGVRDDRVSSEDLEEWRRHTTGSFARHMFAGDHFYLSGTERRMLLELLAATLAPHATRRTR